jgi:hypothetical protein
MQSAGLIVRSGERGAPAWRTALADARVDDHPEPVAELRRLAGLSRAHRNHNLALERLAGGDHAGAVEAARELCSRLVGDPNARLRLGLTLAADGDPEGAEILAVMAERSGKWLAYARALCLRHHIDPDPILDDLRPEG